MSPEMARPGADETIHERARMLAAESMDSALERVDAEWLGGHLASCPECAAVAEDHRAIHDELRSLAAPEPPRDLWPNIGSFGSDRCGAGSPARGAAGPPDRTTGVDLHRNRGGRGSHGYCRLAPRAEPNSLAGSSAQQQHQRAVVALGSTPPNPQSASPQAPITVVNG